MLQNEYLVAKVGVDTAENEPSNVSPKWGVPSSSFRGHVCALRAVQTSDYMTADWYHLPYEVLGKVSTRIINEVKGINRVTFDISSKPPATIEWE